MNECNIVKDLMPLAVDGAASEDSAELVRKHVETCETCALAYADCQRELTQEAARRSYGEAARALQRRHRVRKLMQIALTSIATLALIFAACYGWDVLTVRPLVTLPLDEYEVRLVRMQDGQVKMIVLTDEPGLKVSVDGYGSYEQTSDALQTEYTVQTSILRQHGKTYRTIWEGSWQDGVFWADDDPGVGRIHQSITFTDGGSTRVVYTAGDEIPPASPEMEALDALVASFYAEGKGNGLTDEQQSAYDAQYALVPEFQHN